MTPLRLPLYMRVQHAVWIRPEGEDTSRPLLRLLVAAAADDREANGLHHSNARAFAMAQEDPCTSSTAPTAPRS